MSGDILGDNEKMMAKIKEKGHYHITLEPIIPFEEKVTFEYIDELMKNSIVRYFGIQLPTLPISHSNKGYYVCATHRISHVNQSHKKEVWNCSTNVKFEMYESFLEDLLEECKDEMILDFDHYLKTITMLVIFASNFSFFLQKNMNLKITLYGVKNRNMVTHFNKERHLTGNHICHASEIHIPLMHIKSDNSSYGIKVNVQNISRYLFSQFQILDTKPPDLNKIINQYIDKEFLNELELFNKRQNNY